MTTTIQSPTVKVTGKQYTIFRTFEATGPISNAEFYHSGPDIGPRRGRAVGTSPTKMVELDEATNRMVDELLQSPAIARINLSEFKLEIELRPFFVWSEVQFWIIDCMKRRLGLEIDDDISPQIERHEIGIDRPTGFLADCKFYVTGWLTNMPLERVTSRDLNRLAERQLDNKAYELLKQLFNRTEIHAVSMHETCLYIFLQDGLVWPNLEDLRDHVVKALIEHLGWVEDTRTVNFSFMHGGNAYMMRESDHAVDHTGNE